MPHPSNDPRFVEFSQSESQYLQTAASRPGVGAKGVCAVAKVRSVETFYRAIGGAPVQPFVAAALVSAADTILGSQPNRAEHAA